MELLVWSSECGCPKTDTADMHLVDSVIFERVDRRKFDRRKNTSPMGTSSNFSDLHFGDLAFGEVHTYLSVPALPNIWTNDRMFEIDYRA